MLLVNGYDLAPRDHIGEQLVECPGLHSFRVITHVSTKDTVLVENLRSNRTVK